MYFLVGIMHLHYNIICWGQDYWFIRLSMDSFSVVKMKQIKTIIEGQSSDWPSGVMNGQERKQTRGEREVVRTPT